MHDLANAKLIAGVDEAGRGPLAGPVVAAAVILPQDHSITGLTDSKKLSAKRRQSLEIDIKQQAVAWAVAEVDCRQIDRINILQAAMLAMCNALCELEREPDLVLVDGNRVPDYDRSPIRAIVGGDATESCISAASILAKEHRDRLMLDLHQQYPQYEFDRHKGYPTKLHLEKLRLHGVCPEHRRSFKPVTVFC